MIKKVSLGDVARIYSGGTPSRTKPGYWNGNIPWVKTAQIQNCYINAADIDELITETGMKESSVKMVPKGTILMAMYGQGKTRGQVAVLGLNATINQACAAIELLPIADRDFIYQQLLFSYTSIRNMSNTGGQENLSSSLIKEIPISLPPLPEQKAIAEVLTVWDRAIEKTERLIQAKERRLNALYQNYFRPDSPATINWEKIKIGKLVKPRNERAIPSEESPLYSLTIESGITAKTDRYDREFLVKDSESKTYKTVYPGLSNAWRLNWMRFCCYKSKFQKRSQNKSASRKH